MFAYTMLYVFLIVYNGKVKNRFNVFYILLYTLNFKLWKVGKLV